MNASKISLFFLINIAAITLSAEQQVTESRVLLPCNMLTDWQYKSSWPSVDVLKQATHITCNNSASQEILNVGANFFLLQFAENVRDIYFSNVEGIHDLLPLAGLKQLIKLHLIETSVTDLTPLESLVNLEELGIYSNELVDLTPLRHLTKLKKLYIGGNKIINLAGLEGLENLEELTLSRVIATDLTPLIGLKKLKFLTLDHMNIPELISLELLTSLERLSIYNSGENRPFMMQQLTQMKNLKDISFLHVLITNFEPLIDLKNLNCLHLYFSQITDVESLGKMQQLDGLVICDCRFTQDINIIKLLPNCHVLQFSTSEPF